MEPRLADFGSKWAAPATGPERQTEADLDLVSSLHMGPDQLTSYRNIDSQPRTFHEWLAGGRLVEGLVQVLHADTVEDPMECLIEEIDAGSAPVRPGTSLDNQEPVTIRALLAPVAE